MKVFLLFPFLMTLFSLNHRAHAEYRVFNLKISKPNPDKTQAPLERTVLSTLDPLQYKYYYPVAQDETVSYTETWMCKGRTDWQLDYCPNPKAQPVPLESDPQKAQIPTEPVSNPSTP